MQKKKRRKMFMGDVKRKVSSLKRLVIFLKLFKVTIIKIRRTSKKYHNTILLYFLQNNQYVIRFFLKSLEQIKKIT